MSSLKPSFPLSPYPGLYQLMLLVSADAEAEEPMILVAYVACVHSLVL